MAKKIKYLIIHCTDTAAGREVTKEEIEDWHKSPIPHGRGWTRCGYSDLVQLDGKMISITDWDQDDEIEAHEMTWGAKGYNSLARHVVYSGGRSKDLKTAVDTTTPEQKITLEIYVKFTIMRCPWIEIGGHNQFSEIKECPSFNVPEWLRSIGILEKNICQRPINSISN